MRRLLDALLERLGYTLFGHLDDVDYDGELADLMEADQ